MIELLGDFKRTDYCGDLRKKDVGRKVTLLGWVQKRRDLGGLIFVEMRDRQGIVQVVFNPEINSKAHEKAQLLRNEYVIGVRGEVVSRPKGTENPRLKTGEIEVWVEELKILNSSKNPPFQIEDEEEVAENTRLKYRYLDLRRPGVVLAPLELLNQLLFLLFGDRHCLLPLAPTEPVLKP